MRFGRGPASLLLSTALLLAPRTADGQWYAGVYLGANHTHSADITIDQSAIGRSLTFENVAFEGRPFESPQYYGWRLGRIIGAGKHVAVEFEFLHAKMYAETARVYAVSGPSAGDVGASTPMNAIVQRYAMSHGLNFALVNVVARVPLGTGPVTVLLRSGLGPTIPHAESTIGGEVREQYESAGIGGQLSAGVEVVTWRRLSAAAEYKFTLARPEIEIAHGTGRTTALAHQIAFGLAFALSR